ncbi:MAG: hypothetical protein A2583_09450 [Bdellovibrionales bacterium RIFOXYD1_FULL_53_11]|nr:MAG: hypothetical protein A2583_09450 [Bdellovibrionales bacterium RIFOXYD1_FULL_53_11]
MEINRTILVVDDEQETLRGYEAFLSGGGAAGQDARKSSRRKPGGEVSQPVGAAAHKKNKLLVASSGEQAVELVRNELAAGGRVAAGFFDVKLGAGMDGLSTIQAVRAIDGDIHCVIVTAYHDRTVDEIAALFGEEFSDHWDYLNKPFTQGEIVQKARQMLSAWNHKRLIETMNTQLVRSERMAAIGQVARGVGHEFGNILLRIMGKTDLAMMEKDPLRVQEHLKIIMQATERASAIVRNLQSVSRTAKTGREFSAVSLTQPADEALSLINHELVKASVRIDKEYKTQKTVKLDEGSFGQVFLNLFINALHAMRGGGTLRIVIEEAKSVDGRDGVAARVIDTGTGIAADVLPRIFEYAFSTKGDSGSGLGLAISREIVENHGGSITVKTEAGRGTEFCVWLPAQEK